MRLCPMALLIDGSDRDKAVLALVVPDVQTAEIFGLAVTLVGIETVAQITVSQN
jgi:hypothetical protein